MLSSTRCYTVTTYAVLGLGTCSAALKGSALAEQFPLPRLVKKLLIVGLITFCALYLFARWATRTDPQILRFLLNSTKIRTQYDPMKFEPIAIRRLRRV